MATKDTSQRPKKLGSFEVLEEIGQGGMGVVYLARQPALERRVVLKKIRRDLATDPRVVERFQREARAAAAIHHQNVVSVYDCFSVRGHHCIAQEYVAGKDLRAVLDRAGKIEPRIAALIALETLRGLEEIHASGIVHRDLKPANVLIGNGGDVKIADFGIAFEETHSGLTHPGMMMGSLPYMAPEQMLGSRVDARTDLYAFGLVLYEMLTGFPPFQQAESDTAETLLERMRRGRFTSPRRIQKKIPGFLVRLIRSCLKAKPQRRARSTTRVRKLVERRLGRPSAVDCRLEIARHLQQAGILDRASRHDARDEPRSMPHAHPARQHRWMRTAALASVVGLSALALASGWFPGVVGRGRSEAQERSLTAPRAALDRPGAVGATTQTTAQPAPSDAKPFAEAPAPAAPPAEPARLRFVADPWAEVTLEDGTQFHTPRASYLALPPGLHTLVFQHPRLGRAEYSVELASGEIRTLRHVFEETSEP